MNKSPSDIIVELESDNSRLFKESVICREMENDNKEFFEGVRLCCDKLFTFGVSEKTIPEKTDHYNENGTNGVPFSEFKNLLDKLISRTLTGNAAKDALEELCYGTSYYVWNNWYKRILLKDLKCGVSEKTINNCSKKINKPQYSVRVFSCQLAHNSTDFPKKMVGEKIIDVKLDGVRLLTLVYPNGEVYQLSREGIELFNFEHIKKQFSSVAASLDEVMVFDGEIVSKEFQELMTQLHRKENVDTKKTSLRLFDMVPYEDFKKGVYKIKQINRLEKLHAWVNNHRNTLSGVDIIDYEIVDLDDKFGKKRFNEIYTKSIELGLEGIMIKDLNAPYVCGRSTAWLKLKPVLSVDLTIVGMKEGKGKYKNTLGALLCEDWVDGKFIKVNVSGIPDNLRDKYWNNPSDVNGKIAEIECDKITQNKNGGYSLRFPRFVRLRGFEVGEKI